MSVEASTETNAAVVFTSALWTGIRAKEGPRPNSANIHVLRRLFTPAALGELSLPIGKDRQPGQTVALGGGESGELNFVRPQTPQELAEEYDRKPRVRIYESVDARSGGWTAIVTSALGNLAKCEVTCTVYESAAGEQTLGPHYDQWYGAIVQHTGAKNWYIGDDARTRSGAPTFTLEAGDVLLLPPNVLHDVSTPDYSVHMGIAFLTDRPLPSV